MTMKPLIIAARYKYLLIVPFLVILPVALGLMLFSNTHKYTSLVEGLGRAIIARPHACPTSDNQFQTPAQNRASDLQELLATDSFSLDIAKRAGMPIDTAAQKGVALAAVRAGTSVVAEGTAPRRHPAQRIDCDRSEDDHRCARRRLHGRSEDIDRARIFSRPLTSTRSNSTTSRRSWTTRSRSSSRTTRAVARTPS